MPGLILSVALLQQRLVFAATLLPSLVRFGKRSFRQGRPILARLTPLAFSGLPGQIFLFTPLTHLVAFRLQRFTAAPRARAGTTMARGSWCASKRAQCFSHILLHSPAILQRLIGKDFSRPGRRRDRPFRDLLDDQMPRGTTHRRQLALRGVRDGNIADVHIHGVLGEVGGADTCLRCRLFFPRRCPTRGLRLPKYGSPHWDSP